ncbi:MAG: DUF4124 domain-containing protein [Burkholderiales bacterium]|nr:DUF4124 domain-containing protein [Burkholderiales bacterium]
MRKLVGMLLSLGCVVASTSHAEVYRCQGATGKVEFSDVPCPTGAASTTLTVRPNVLNSAEGREQALRADNQRLAQQLEAEQRKNQAASQSGKTQPDLQAAQQNSLECRRAKRDYEVSASSIQPNKGQVSALASAMYGACGLREPDRTINKTVVNVNAQGRQSTPAPAGDEN